jgi:hypothetical protein
MSKISLFTDYHQTENTLTNHCGLILKLLYEENPKSFEEVITNLINTDKPFEVRPTFEQQRKLKKSVTDLIIRQPSFSILIETKRFDWFHKGQIDRHIEGFDVKTNYKILFLLSNFEEDNIEDKFAEQIEEAKKVDVILQPLTFEKLVDELEKSEHSDNFSRFLSEFKEYLDKKGYFPTWRYLLDVVNCASTIHEVREQNVFMCPNTGGVYSHKRAKYFGGYKYKNVEFIHEIKAIVIIEKDMDEATVLWKNYDIENEDLINEAKQKINIWDYRKEEIKQRSLQVFLLQNPHLANYRKISSGGMYSNKRYFFDIAKNPIANNSKELADKLFNKTWE